jgi:hypothetical protein
VARLRWAAVDEQLRDDIARRKGDRARCAFDARTDCGWRHGHSVQRRVGNRCERLRARLRDATSRGPPSRRCRGDGSANPTATANDIGRDDLPATADCPWLRHVAFAISTSGGSTNVVAALEEARKRGMLTVALLGYDGGEIVRRGLADVPVVVRCDYIPRIQEAQASIYHVLIDLLHVLHTHGHA